MITKLKVDEEAQLEIVRVQSQLARLGDLTAVLVATRRETARHTWNDGMEHVVVSRAIDY